MLSALLIKLTAISAVIVFVNCLPVSDTTAAGEEKTTHLKENDKLSPIEEGEDNELVEIQEKDIPEGATVLVVEEGEEEVVPGESMKTASNVVFRPLFVYRMKQENIAQRRSNRFRRRYYVPRRSYRESYYPRYRNRNKFRPLLI